MSTTTIKRTVAVLAAAATMAGIGLAGAGTAQAAQPYDIIVNAGAGGDNSLKNRELTAYKLADYVDGTYVSVGNKSLDGVAVDTPDDLKPYLNRVLAKTAGVKDVTELPGWTYATDPSTGWQVPGAAAPNENKSTDNAGGDPIAWLGGFRQTPAGENAPGDNQASGSFGYGWNESGPQGNGNNSPDKAYTGSVREFADNLVKDEEAMAQVRKQPHSQTVTCKTGKTCTIELTAAQGTGVYLIIDSAGKATWSGTNEDGYKNTWTVGVTAPMIVPTKADTNDLATLPGYSPSDPNNLGTTGKLGEITIKNVVDEEVLPDITPKRRDETVKPGQDAADNGSDVWDVVPYVVNYRIPDLSSYKAAYDNKDPWIFNYRVIDKTQPGLRIDGAPTVTLDGKAIQLTEVKDLPDFAAPKTGTKDGQPGEPDAWYYLATDSKTDASHLVIGLGRWIVKNYGDIKLNDKTKTLYQHEFTIKYSATVTDKVLEHHNMTNNENWLDYSHNPDDVNSGEHHETPHVTVKQWTYDIDLHKRASTSNAGLEDAEFALTVKDNRNASDAKPNGTVLKFVPASDVKGDYRLANAEESKDGGKGSTTLVTGKDGLLRVRGLDLGVYTLTETKAPERYQLLQQSEDLTIAASFIDDKTDYITPNAQTEASLSITQNNKVTVLQRPLLNFAVEQKDAPKGLTITATKATWTGQDDSGAYYADNQTSWVPADLALWNQPINTMLAKTGGAVGIFLIVMAGAGLLGGGIVLFRRATARRDGDRNAQAATA